MGGHCLGLLGSEWWIRLSFVFCIKFVFLYFVFFSRKSERGRKEEGEGKGYHRFI